ncbi:MAG: hypothetical protein JWR19_2999 [Pedosphaera sp.]|nr:hypothetical protein [Pedosphaera sp.]
MNEPSTSIWKRQIIPELGVFRFFRWLFSWRMIRRYLFCLACLVTLLALFYAEENWRGRHAWEKYKREAIARGEQFNVSAFIPPTVPDDQNFAATPFFASLFDFKPGTQEARDTNATRRFAEFQSHHYPSPAAAESKAPKATPVNSWVRHQPNLPFWYSEFVQSTNKVSHSASDLALTNASPQEAARDIMTALAFANPVLDEIRTTSQRPASRFNIRYENDDPAAILLPHLAGLKEITVILQTRAFAELTLGQTNEAFDDLILSLRMTDALKDEPIIISQLVRSAQLNIAILPIYQGLVDHQWTEPQLRALQEKLEHFDFCNDGQRALQSERVFFGGGIFEFLRHAPSNYKLLFFVSGAPDDQLGGNSISGQAIGFGMAIAPKGWSYFEQLNYTRTYGDLLLPIIDSENRRINPALCAKADQQLGGELKRSPRKLFFHHQVFSALLLPALANIVQKTARTQTAADETVLACALERYRLAHGQFPETLDALMPQFISQLPHDVINGQSYHYRLTSDGQFVLYSVGWNETDDGGTVATTTTGSTDFKNGDWVWQYPTR